MLDYFISHRNYKEVDTICELLNTLKHRIENQDYNDCYKEFKQAAPLFDQIKALAICDKNEQMANAQLVFNKYFKFFCKVSEYNQLLKNKEYKSSWDTLQDCLDLAVFVGKFTDLQNRFDLPDLIQLLSKYEKLYPYNLFLSSEFIIKSAHCSICGKSMLNLDCPHIAGNIYWGEIAIRCVDEIEKFQAVALVRNPEDKRCIIESEEMQKLPETERFKKLHLFCDLNKPFLINFDIEEIIENRRDLSIPKQGRNDRCACGSGLKFKKCCINKMYYKHLHNILIPLDRINLAIFNNLE